MKYRALIIGAGIVGLSIARVLTRYENLEVIVVEKEPDVGWGVSKANTGIVHPGHEEDPSRHPLRAKLCKEGNALWRKWARELDIPAAFPGELMVFFNEEERARAREYLKLAKANGVPEVKELSGEELRSLEPSLNSAALGAIYAPTGGVISPFEAVIALAENAAANGAKFLFERKVERVVASDGRVKGVETSGGFIKADIVINAAGLYADTISHTLGLEPDFEIKPRKGEYLLFDEDVPVKPRLVLHTTPTPISKGIYAVTTTHRTLMIGPTAVDLERDMREDLSVSARGLEILWREAGKLLREQPPRNKLIRVFAGLRPEPSTGDWLIKSYDKPWGFINVAGIRSPGLTGAPAIAHYVLELMEKGLGIELREKGSWNPYRRNIVRISEIDIAEADKLVRENPDYGEIVCYCRKVSRAEVIEAIERMREIGVRTFSLDGIKFRTLAGFGRCQGAFCRWRIAMIISEYLGAPLEEIRVGRGKYVVGDIKALRRGPQ